VAGNCEPLVAERVHERDHVIGESGGVVPAGRPYWLVNVAPNPSGRFGAPETEPGPSGGHLSPSRSPSGGVLVLRIAVGKRTPNQ
jgi:hypothetical protein